ncbi:hypothetical protein AB0K92_15870 [Streptomyces sp. NPDC052687]|uniref:hypothetical protein n=1 Tax=Streptomyces sp. NPDC052687 TaxID=3154759 RepID=UPI003425A5D4
MTYRITLQCGAAGVVDELSRRRLLRQAEARGWERTRVRGGHVVTLPGGRMVALIAQAP